MSGRRLLAAATAALLAGCAALTPPIPTPPASRPRRWPSNTGSIAAVWPTCSAKRPNGRRCAACATDPLRGAGW